MVDGFTCTVSWLFISSQCMMSMWFEARIDNPVVCIFPVLFFMRQLDMVTLEVSCIFIPVNGIDAMLLKMAHLVIVTFFDNESVIPVWVILVMLVSII